MILKHFEPERDFSWGELDVITGYIPGKWTWATQGLLWLKRRGYEIRSIDAFDYQTFAKGGADYLIEFLGPDVGKEQIAMCDITREMELTKQFLEEVGAPVTREATLQDFRQVRRQGFVTGVNLNARALNGLGGYISHYVVLIDAGPEARTLARPGLPPRANRKVKIADFEKAWAYPDSKAKSLTAVRLATSSGT